MSEVVVDVKNVSIKYITGDFKGIGFKEFLMRKLTGNYKVTEFWADKDINFTLEKGDMLGLIGTNGAGKSTLLKAITGIMFPSEGKVVTKGNIAAFLELATGFDADLTVKENTYLRGALLGYTRKFMDEKYKEIIEFAELEEFQNYSFRQLSSGMKSRLAFSIACLVDPDILILDEVLSVGDGSFRKKSGDRMLEILNNGVTGILVSHMISQVEELCNKVLWLDHGHQIAFGETVPICNAYTHYIYSPKNKRKIPENMDEIKQISRDFQLYQALSLKERIEGKGNEFLANESIEACEQRWMNKLSEMNSSEKEELYKEYIESSDVFKVVTRDNKD